MRYSHTDCGGVVYHANYLDYFEWGRTEFLREFASQATSAPDTPSAVTYRDMEQAGFQLVVVHAELDYLRASRYDDRLRVRTVLDAVTGVRLEFRYEVTRLAEAVDGSQAEERVCTGGTTLACLDAATGRPRRLPDWLRALAKR